MLALALLLDAWNASMSAVVRAHLHARDAMFNILAMHALHLLLALPVMKRLGLAAGLRAGDGDQPRLRHRRAPVVVEAALRAGAGAGRTGGAIRRGSLGPVLHIGPAGAAR
jgi:hypothetical protein